MLADIRKSLATLAAPSLGQVVQPSPQPLASAPATPSTVGHTSASPTPQVSMQAQDPTAQALLAVSRLLATINVPANNPHSPTTPWALNDSLQNSVADLNHQVDALSEARSVPPLQTAAVSLSVTPATGALQSTFQQRIVRQQKGQGSTHCFQDQKPDLGISMICYANKILKAQHMYGGTSWLEYDRDFRWAKCIHRRKPAVVGGEADETSALRVMGGAADETFALRVMGGAADETSALRVMVGAAGETSALRVMGGAADETSAL
ncbi:hypothetical protein NDU88_001232 [Pleurodeles waltl]|uniref:Uncharacterized protein n=1 Tax=Pleurodeles waltl TaxID=8319 RepID=A0AAV7U7J2_PLEWA|nr:hypothetical protein NDU88_001232 [Pleurodeles waltl]